MNSHKIKILGISTVFFLALLSSCAHKAEREERFELCVIDAITEKAPRLICTPDGQTMIDRSITESDNYLALPKEDFYRLLLKYGVKRSHVSDPFTDEGHHTDSLY